MKKLIVLPLIFVVLSASAQNPVQGMDTLFQTMIKYGQINGTVLVAENGRVLFDRSYGFSDRSKRTLNTGGTEFALASVSKIFTSVAILQLKEKGKLRLDDPVVKYFPDFPYPDITIRHLLSHTSGLPDYQIYEEQINQHPDKIFTNADLLSNLKQWKEPLPFRPGDRWQYSNTNFCLLALLVEKISGMRFQHYVQQYLFKPAGMSNTYFLTDTVHQQGNSRAENYEYPFLFSENPKNADSIADDRWRTYNAMGFVGQGNIETTTRDMLKFDQALYSAKLLQQFTLNEALTPTRLNNGKTADAAVTLLGKSSYGLGWFILVDSSMGKIVYHTGGQPGALSMFIRNISRKQTLVLFDNLFHKSLYQNGLNFLTTLNHRSTVFSKEAAAVLYGKKLVESGIDAGYCELEKLKADTLHYKLTEDDLNDLGLQLLYAETSANHNQLALEVLKLNTIYFSNSFNTWDSYGEALAKVGATSEAIAMYQKSLILNPQSESGRQAILKLTAGQIKKE